MTYINLRTGAEMFGCGSSVLCLGTFDGVHRGHTELIKETIKMKDKLKEDDPKILGGAWCFRQPPAAFLSNTPCNRITTLEEKLEIFKQLGLDFVAIADFNEVRDTDAFDFVSDFLKNRCGCKGIVCGFNFTFGKDRLGTPDILKKEFDKNANILPPVIYDGETVSSSEIRRYILDGNTERANQLIGRPYSITSAVIDGKKLGRKLGFPTINQVFPEEKILPLGGVYATKTLLDGKEYISVTNLGKNPTFENNFIRCETYIMDYSGDLYGKTVKVSFYKHLRSEQKFNSAEELIAAIKKDITETEKYFKS